MAVDCKEVTPLLNRIWDEFRQFGLGDDLIIFENLAYLFLLKHLGYWDRFYKEIIGFQEGVFQDFPIVGSDDLLHREFVAIDSKLIPRPSGLKINQFTRVVYAVDDLFSQGNLAKAYNECMIFRLENMQRGGRYPTPRHITNWMAKIAELQEGMTLADLACGSGGFLVAAASKQPQVTGLEISPNWARLAWANSILHNLSEPEIRIQNTYEWARQINQETKFDRIIMNPPFGEKVEKFLQYDSDIPTSRSETAFTEIGLRVLKPSGRMVILLPAGLLFSANLGDRDLRKSLIADFQIQALIGLPKDSIQPYSSMKTHILVVNKPEKIQPWNPTKGIWFYDVRHDGFSSGRNRQPEPEKDELPRLTATFSQQSENPHVILSTDGQPSLEIRRITNNGVLCSYRLTHPEEYSLKLKRISSPNKDMPDLFAQVASQKGYHGSILVHTSDNYFINREEPTPLQIEFPTLEGVLQELQIVMDDDSRRALILDGNQGQLGRGQNRQLLQLHHPQDRGESKVFLTDLSGNALAGTFTLPWERIPKDLRVSPFGIFPVEDANANPFGNLIILENANLEAYKFEQSENGNLAMVVAKENALLLWTNKTGELKRLEMAQVKTTYRSEKGRTGIAVDGQGNWFGVQVTAETIVQNGYNLQPETYFPAEIEQEVLPPPARILSDIKLKQIELGERIDFLMGIIEGGAKSNQRTPPRLADDLHPFGTLTPIQAHIWEQIQSFVEEVGAEDDRYLTPGLFQPEDLYAEFSPTEVDKTIELFTRMGVIVPVTINQAPYYRRLTETDLVEVP